MSPAATADLPARRRSQTTAVLVALAWGVAALARAANPAPAPPNYAAFMAGTTAAYRPNGGPWGSFPGDVSPYVGYGRYLGKSVALELDLGPTYLKGRYTSFTLVPAVVWTFSSHAYFAARFLVPVDPDANFGLFPGVGVFRSFGRYSPYAELNLASYVGRGHPDFGVSVTAGVLIAF